MEHKRNTAKKRRLASGSAGQQVARKTKSKKPSSQSKKKVQVEEDFKGPITLYRVGDPKTKAGFWTPDPDYASKHLGLTTKQHVANILKGTTIMHEIVENANADDIKQAEELGYDIITFPMWDYDADEWVVINPKVLLLID